MDQWTKQNFYRHPENRPIYNPVVLMSSCFSCLVVSDLVGQSFLAIHRHPDGPAGHQRALSAWIRRAPHLAVTTLEGSEEVIREHQILTYIIHYILMSGAQNFRAITNDTSTFHQFPGPRSIQKEA